MLKLSKCLETSIVDLITYCYHEDLSLQQFTNDFDLNDRINAEIEMFTNTPVKFYRVYNEKEFIGYYGIEEEPIIALSTFYILPKYREYKNEIFNYMVQDIPLTFFSGLFDKNIRAQKFFLKMGGKEFMKVLVKNYPFTIYKFERN